VHNIKGDSIGPSIMEVAVKIIDATGVKIDREHADAGMAAFDKHGTPLPDETLTSIDKNRIAFKGTLTTSVWGQFRIASMSLCVKNTIFMPIFAQQKLGKVLRQNLIMST